MANLLLEKQLVCDAFDRDPFELTSNRGHSTDSDENDDDDDDDDGLLEKKKNAELIDRVKVSEE